MSKFPDGPRQFVNAETGMQTAGVVSENGTKLEVITPFLGSLTFYYDEDLGVYAHETLNFYIMRVSAQSWASVLNALEPSQQISHGSWS